MGRRRINLERLPAVERLEERRFLSVGTGSTGSGSGSAGAALDGSWGVGGMVVTSVLDSLNTDHFDGADKATDAVTLPGGKLLVAGSADSQGALALVRYLPNGTLDPSFGFGGQAVHNFGSGKVGYVTSLKLQGDKILVAGSTNARSSTIKGFVSRFHADGTPDTSFGDGGTALIDYETRSAVERIGVAQDGSILAAGTIGYAAGNDEDFAVAKLTPDGQVDFNFGENGYAVLDLGGLDSINDMVLQPDGKIVVAGGSVAPVTPGQPWEETGMWLARYLPDGSPDDAFGGGGRVNLPAAVQTRAARLALAPGGEIVVAGPLIPDTVTPRTTFDVMVARFTPSGELDGSFGNGGRVVSPAVTNVVGLSVDADSNVMLSGFRLDVNVVGNAVGSRSTFSFFSSTGARDLSVGANGQYVVRHVTADTMASAQVLSSSRLYVVGSGSMTNQQGFNSYGFKVAAFRPEDFDASTSGSVVKPVIGKGGAKLSGRELRVKGSKLNDLIQLDRVGAKIRVMVNGKTQSFLAVKVKTVRVEGGDGDDAVVIGTRVMASSVFGGKGNDTLIGGNGNDKLFGDAGDDTLDGRSGKDRLDGGDGNDFLFGGDPVVNPNSSLPGNDGRDSLLGGDGDDALRPGSGHDVANGGNNVDRVLSAPRPGTMQRFAFQSAKSVERML